jgi:steroid 5-alpha reductase family enzyme
MAGPCSHLIPDLQAAAPVFDLDIYLYGLLVAVLGPALTWVVSLFRRDVSIVDSIWSLVLLGLCATYYLLNEYPTARGSVVLALVAAWALRLSVYITWRNRGEPEDARYQAMRRKYDPNFALKSLVIVFLLQGLLAWIISLPLLAAVTGSPPLRLLDAAAMALVVFGILFETIADAQLAAFRRRTGTRRKVMDTGLWRYTRHPNYFGECCVWWGLYLFAAAAGGWWSMVSPLLMTFLLLRVSGVALLEKDIGERRPDYAAYIERTNAFIPGLPRNRQDPAS